ncbi:hypothetical protein NE619_08940 [Anaerovorax odorimutans]|uniref:Uncharacterized protein n=1 Tax=Anaerovorax odorimutans TaxID=109327 RepID=A0ABT1RNV4_9FIRM|nr:hypothetical protein [Anaerovorax odorimutans]MCQ4636855.1 hypothetical protein [Anaerovorax odorimutans]
MLFLYFVQQRICFGFVVDVFPRVCGLCPCWKLRIDQVFVPGGSVSLKKAQQDLGFSLDVDKNRNLPFGPFSITCELWRASFAYGLLSGMGRYERSAFAQEVIDTGISAAI